MVPRRFVEWSTGAEAGLSRLAAGEPVETRERSPKVMVWSALVVARVGPPGANATANTVSVWLRGVLKQCA